MGDCLSFAYGTAKEPSVPQDRELERQEPLNAPGRQRSAKDNSRDEVRVAKRDSSACPHAQVTKVTAGFLDPLGFSQDCVRLALRLEIRMDNNDIDFALSPELSPEAREYFKRYKAVAEKFIAQSNQKPLSWARIEAQNRMQEEIKQIAAEYLPGTVGTLVGSNPMLQIHQYKGFDIAIYTFPRLNGQFSTLSGVRKSGAPMTEEGFPLADAEFPTYEAAVKAALEQCKKEIDASV
jgi:hypothetical protein